MVYPRGLDFPFRISQTGSMSVSEQVEKIRANLKALVLTSINERVVYKNVGTVGYKAVLRDVPTSLITELVREAILKHEKRAKVLAVTVDKVADQGVITCSCNISFLYTLTGEQSIVNVNLS